MIISKEKRRKKGVIYLTFDDGPSENVTPEILKTLEKYKVPATFFIVNYSKEKLPILKRELENGCTIGIHGYSHDYSQIYKSVEDYMQNIIKLDKKLKEDLAYDAFITRFPGGSSNRCSAEFCKGIMTRLVKAVQEAGYLYTDWNVDSLDAKGNGIPAKQILKSVKLQCNPRGYNTILMHDASTKMTSAEALPEIIEWGLANGYTFKAIDPHSVMVHRRVKN